MSIGRFSRRGFAYQGWAWAGWSRASGEAVAVDLTDGWRSCEFNRVAVATAVSSTVVACELSRVVWAKPQGK